MNDDLEFTAMLERWLDTREAPSSVGGVTEATLAELMTTPQERPLLRSPVRMGRPPLRLLAVAAALTATGGLAAFISGGGRGPSVVRIAPTPSVTTTVAPTLSPNPYPAVIQRIVLGGATWQILGTPGRIWVQSDDVGVTGIDPITGEVVGTVSGGHSMFLHEEQLWVQKGGEQVLVRVDPDTGLELARFDGIPGSIAAKDGDTVWSVDLVQDVHVVVATDLNTGEQVASIEVPAEPKQIVLAGGSVWVACDSSGVLVRIDPETHEVVDTVEVGAGPVELELGFESLWIRNRLLELVRVDPQTGAVIERIGGFGASPSLGLSFGGGLVWASAPQSIAAVDPLTNEIVRDIPLPGTMFHDTFWVDGSLWVTTADTRTVLQVDAGTP